MEIFNAKCTINDINIPILDVKFLDGNSYKCKDNGNHSGSFPLNHPCVFEKDNPYIFEFRTHEFDSEWENSFMHLTCDPPHDIAGYYKLINKRV
jgi:hypothetical protein